MTSRKFFKPAAAVAAFAAIILAGMLINSPRVKATDDDDDDRNESKIQRGFEIAPVHLNLEGKNRELVGLGSYIVNGQGDCNGCHSASPQTEFVPGRNPYFLNQQTEKINPATYLGGGRDFGAFDRLQLSAHIFTRNLTPDRTGLPEGGHTFAEFIQIMRTGVDMDHLHPTCPPGVLDTGCVPAPFDGTRLQIMPWPIYKNMTDHDLRAIYEYLSAIPCIDTIVPDQPQLRNNCS
jgi:hypothetical protein